MKANGFFAVEMKIPSYFPPLSALLPAARSGNVEVEHFEVTRRAALASLYDGAEFVPEGFYTRLVIDGVTHMTDGPVEQHYNRAAVERARGDVLVLGLGLGMILTRILPKRSVKSVTVIERSKDVIALVQPGISTLPQAHKLKLYNVDAHAFAPLAQYDFIWIDLCFGLSRASLAERRELIARYRPHLKPIGEIAAWKMDELEERERGWDETVAK